MNLVGDLFHEDLLGNLLYGDLHRNNVIADLVGDLFHGNLREDFHTWRITWIFIFNFILEHPLN